MARPVRISTHSLKIRGGISVSVANALERTAREYVREVAKAAKSELSALGVERTGLLNKAISAKVKIYRDRNYSDTKSLLLNLRIWGGVGVDSNIRGVDKYGNDIIPTKYAHLIEYGHATKNGGMVAAKPFMRSAIASVGGAKEIEKRMANAAKEGLENAK